MVEQGGFKRLTVVKGIPQSSPASNFEDLDAIVAFADLWSLSIDFSLAMREGVDAQWTVKPSLLMFCRKAHFSRSAGPEDTSCYQSNLPRGKALSSEIPRISNLNKLRKKIL